MVKNKKAGKLSISSSFANDSVMSEFYSYALVLTFFEKEHSNYLDVFCPLVIKAVQKIGNASTIDKIYDSLNSIIPMDVLKAVTERNVQRGHIARIRYAGHRLNYYELTEKGTKYYNRIEKEDDVKRRVRKFEKHFKHYFEEKKVNLEIVRPYDEFKSFIKRNASFIFDFFCGEESSLDLPDPEASSRDQYIFDYIGFIRSEEKDYYATLRDIILGLIISTIINSDKKINQIRAGWCFKDTKIFLDSNFLLSLYGWRSTEEIGRVKAANELFKLLRDYGFGIKVLEITKNEISRHIKGYEDTYDDLSKLTNSYPAYSSYKRRGFTKLMAQRFRTNLERELFQKGVIVEKKLIDINQYKHNRLFFKLREHKSYRGRDDGEENVAHDVAVMEFIKKDRNQSVPALKQIKSIFLTSDKTLSRFNHFEMNHASIGTIGEVVLDQLLVIILWLRNPRLKISVDSIISAHSQDLLVKESVWEYFTATLKQLMVEQDVPEDCIPTLLYDDYIIDVLNGFKKKDVQQITGQFIMEKYETAKTRMDDHKKQLEEYDRSRERIAEAVSSKANSKAKNIIKKRKEIRMALVTSFVVIVSVNIAFLSYLIYTGAADLHVFFLIVVLELFLGAVAVSIGLLTDLGLLDFKKSWNMKEQELINKLHDEYVQDFALGDLLSSKTEEKNERQE
ncbi:MAG: hypothetical protein ACFFD4_20585 [Candidatus Odinarchaeota archaeon]